MAVPKPKVALVHDYLRDYGDPEQVLTGLHHLYPYAPVYTAFVDEARLQTQNHPFATWDIRPTFAQKLPGILKSPHYYHFLLPYLWESLDLSGYDLVISSSSCYLSHAVLTGPQTLHVCYCHTPSRMLWDTQRPAERNCWTAWNHSRLRQYDFYAAQRVDRFITNSNRAARRIRKIYRQKAEVICPPVQIQGSGSAGERYFVYIGPLDRRAQVDVLVRACSALDAPLQLIGVGPDEKFLRDLASPSVEFLGQPSPQELTQVYANAMALIFPQFDVDFGFIPLEAMGRGLPVIAYKQSGMGEIVLHYRTGLLFDQPTVESLCEAIQAFEKLRFFSQACIDRAQEFSAATFASKLEWYIAQALDER
jgi:glycosyltransferase involved in cell wall biosynthesis